MGLGHARATSYLRTVAYISHPQPFQLFETFSYNYQLSQ